VLRQQYGDAVRGPGGVLGCRHGSRAITPPTGARETGVAPEAKAHEVTGDNLRAEGSD
jgi:hypothetical protein